MNGKRTFVIGDVHGCYKELVELLDKLPVDYSEDKLVFVGDYIDRGEQSWETVKLVQSLGKTHGREHVVVLRGNHEQMAIEYYENGNERWFRNGAGATIASFEEHGESVSDFVGYFDSLDRYHEDEHCIYVHAGIRPGVPMAEQVNRDLEWIRSEFYDEPGGNGTGKLVVFGHTPTRAIDGSLEPLQREGMLGIDTACVYGGRLTAVELVGGRLTNVYSVNSSRVETGED